MAVRGRQKTIIVISDRQSIKLKLATQNSSNMAVVYSANVIFIFEDF